ncbi:MAG: class I SAM-dependent methyltransferase, partial [Pacificimonas sp.]|nr:class I SAM-dependent methyltransferase [Pacificimonas sp.]
MSMRHRIQFPPESSTLLSQSDAAFLLHEPGQEPIRMRFHDYDEIYRRPGLYEQVFYDRLQCSSPEKVAQLLDEAVRANGERLAGLRVLDLGAGNGIVGEALKARGVARLVGADIIPEAREAAYRDRPHVYDDYLVADMTALTEEQRAELSEWRFDALTVIAALGFADIPVQAFVSALDFVRRGGWIAFNIKESFLSDEDQSGFSKFIRRLMMSPALQVHHLERYQHRLSMEGEPLY